MNNQAQLRDKLLALQGLDTSGPCEAQVGQFRKQLSTEEHRTKRLAWLNVTMMWIWAGAMLTLCMLERLWERLHIPFAAIAMIMAFLLVGVGMPSILGLGRRLKQTGARRRPRRVNRMASLCALLYSHQWTNYSHHANA